MTAKKAALPPITAVLPAVRVRPAHFAAMTGVSRQCVHKWIVKGVILKGTDGLVDVTESSRRVIEQTRLSRLRATVLRDLTTPPGELAARVRSLESELNTTRAALARLQARNATMLDPAELAERHSQLQRRIAHNLDTLADAREMGGTLALLREWTDEAMKCRQKPEIHPPNDEEAHERHWNPLNLGYRR